MRSRRSTSLQRCVTRRLLRSRDDDALAFEPGVCLQPAAVVDVNAKVQGCVAALTPKQAFRRHTSSKTAGSAQHPGRAIDRARALVHAHPRLLTLSRPDPRHGSPHGGVRQNGQRHPGHRQPAERSNGVRPHLGIESKPATRCQQE
jgi:hypothetical protein